MIRLKRIYDKKEDIPADHQGLFEETGEGKWTLAIEIEGLVPAKRVDDFRTTNLALVQRLQAYGDKDHGGGEMTPERVTELAQKAQDLDDSKIVKASEVAKKVEERTAEMKTKYEKDIAALKTQLSTVTESHAKSVIEAYALEAGAEFGLRPTAAEDLVDRVRKIFRVDESGEPTAYQDDGKTVRYGADDKPMRGKQAIREEVKKLATGNGKHLFEDNSGAGGDPNKKGSRHTGEQNVSNPWLEGKTYNLTKQGQIVRENPELAVRLAAQAGVTLNISPADRVAA